MACCFDDPCPWREAHSVKYHKDSLEKDPLHTSFYSVPPQTLRTLKAKKEHVRSHAASAAAAEACAQQERLHHGPYQLLPAHAPPLAATGAPYSPRTTMPVTLQLLSSDSHSMSAKPTRLCEVSGYCYVSSLPDFQVERSLLHAMKPSLPVPPLLKHVPLASMCDSIKETSSRRCLSSHSCFHRCGRWQAHDRSSSDCNRDLFHEAEEPCKSVVCQPHSLPFHECNFAAPKQSASEPPSSLVRHLLPSDCDDRSSRSDGEPGCKARASDDIGMRWAENICQKLNRIQTGVHRAKSYEQSLSKALPANELFPSFEERSTGSVRCGNAADESQAIAAKAAAGVCSCPCFPEHELLSANTLSTTSRSCKDSSDVVLAPCDFDSGSCGNYAEAEDVNSLNSTVLLSPLHTQRSHGFDGKWTKGRIVSSPCPRLSGVSCTRLQWDEGGLETVLEVFNARVCSMDHNGRLYTGCLKEDGTLHWSDGDIWSRSEVDIPAENV